MAAARRMYGGGQDDTVGMLAAWGMTDEMARHFAASAEEAVWPENWQPVEVFAAMSTQWRHGFAGPTGLDYGVLSVVMRITGVVPADERDVFDAVRVMEVEAMEQIRNGRRQ